MLELFEIEKEAYQTEYSITNGLIPYSETSTPTNIFWYYTQMVLRIKI